MELKLPFDINSPVTGEASTIIDADQQTVFSYVAVNYFNNYPKWAPEIREIKPLSGEKIDVGVKGWQARQENDEIIESTFVVDEFLPLSRFVIQGADPAFKSCYLTEINENKKQTRLTYKFELIEVDIFMRPFVKLIQAAIDEGTENAVERIRELITAQTPRRAG